MSNPFFKKVTIVIALLLASFVVNAGEREILFNEVQVSEHNIQVIEKHYGVRFESGRYWYDRSSGLWGREGGGPEGRIAAGLHIGGQSPEAFADSGAAPDMDMDEDVPGTEGMSSEEVGELIGGVLGLLMLGEMMDSMDEYEQGYYEGDGYYDGGAYQSGPNSYYDDQGNYEYNSRYGSGSQNSDGSWIHSSNAAGGSVGATSDGCIYTSFGWSNC